MIYYENRSTGLHKMQSLFFVCFAFWFLIIISESAGERGLIFSGFTMEIPELHHWHCSNLYFFKSGHVFSRLPSQSYYCFHKYRMCSVIKRCLNNLSLLLTLSRWQTFPGRAFLIQNTFHQPSLLWLLVTSAMSR